jgi:hypothetical protein
VKRKEEAVSARNTGSSEPAAQPEGDCSACPASEPEKEASGTLPDASGMLPTASAMLPETAVALPDASAGLQGASGIRRLLSELEREHGPIDSKVMEEVRQAWPVFGEKPGGRRSA